MVHRSSFALEFSNPQTTDNHAQGVSPWDEVDQGTTQAQVAG